MLIKCENVVDKFQVKQRVVLIVGIYIDENLTATISQVIKAASTILGIT